MTDYPHLTVAAVVAREGRFLCVEETIDGRQVVNQPAGHVEPEESLLDAVRRETLEETAWEFEPEGLVGLYRWRSPGGTTFIRLAFHGRLLRHHPQRPLDADIDSALWLSPEDLRREPRRLRSPLVLQCAEDYLAGERHPLSILKHLA